jgi:hypothetical protein
MRFLQGVLGFVLLAASLHSAEPDALAIEASILARHMPFGTILNPILSADGKTVVGYTRCGDSAIWTGHYLAAEAFRYKVTLAPDALANVRTALNGLTLLTDITGINLLARCAVPADSPFAAGITSEEKNNGIHPATVNGKSWSWIGNTSRDQYIGVFFGLGAAYDLISDTAIRASISTLASRLLDHLLQTGWTVFMPDGTISTTFLQRPDQQLALLQIGRHVNPGEFSQEYSRDSGALQILVPVPLGVDAADDHSSYFKFNLDFDNLYNLIRLEDSGTAKALYEKGFNLVRSTTDNHLNPHFNMIDRALHGANATRDAETRADLDAWLKRPRTDVFVDLRSTVAVCGTEACRPIPVEQRPPSDFLWQLDPFQLTGGGGGIIETAGIDYILPYWMARYLNVIQEPLVIPTVRDPRKGH